MVCCRRSWLWNFCSWVHQFGLLCVAQLIFTCWNMWGLLKHLFLLCKTASRYFNMEKWLIALDVYVTNGPRVLIKGLNNQRYPWSFTLKDRQLSLVEVWHCRSYQHWGRCNVCEAWTNVDALCSLIYSWCTITHYMYILCGMRETCGSCGVFRIRVRSD